MNTQLIPVFPGYLAEQPVQLVDARLLHTFLQAGKDFSTWIKDRIDGYGFIRNQDYLEFSPNLGKTLKGGRPVKDYHLSIDMAKELGMIERNDKGREIRRYFLDLEKSAKPMAIALQSENHQLKSELLDLYRERQRLLQAPKVAALKTGRWSENELGQVFDYRADGLGAGRISQAMNRSYDGVRSQIRRAGI
jgi:phage anti-repressor protein